MGQRDVGVGVGVEQEPGRRTLLFRVPPPRTDARAGAVGAQRRPSLLAQSSLGCVGRGMGS